MSTFQEYYKQRKLDEALPGRILGHLAAPAALGAASLAGMDTLADMAGVTPDGNAGSMPGLLAGGVLTHLANLPKKLSDAEDAFYSFVKHKLFGSKEVRPEDPAYVKSKELELNDKDASNFQEAIKALKSQSMFMNTILDNLEKIENDPKAHDKDGKKTLLFRLGMSREEYFHDKRIMDKFMSNLDKAISSGTKLSREVPAFVGTVKNLQIMSSAINARLKQLNEKPPEPAPVEKEPEETEHDVLNPKAFVINNRDRRSKEDIVADLINKFHMNRMAANNFYDNNAEAQAPGSNSPYLYPHFVPNPTHKGLDRLNKLNLVKAMTYHHEPLEKIAQLVANRWGMKDGNALAYVKRMRNKHNF